ncbi:restriction endonuclease subunit S [Streptomyces noursei]|uniref:restriction endonuclease subunit S n=1 Tax=Streptomyces noursei TaxID=1971 RepID=UPI0016729D06|nr:restriction endonuclease subunit S [Streptomyces noursei]MCZ1018545.1 restriction endonuclease subunit S [Streptomyces noursei]GGX50358.1 hypothetical protein GCM10010341_85020 [Streptomyces noursei]
MIATADGWVEGAPVQWNRGRIKNLIASAVNGTWGNEPAEDGSDIRCIRAADFDRVRRRVKADRAPLRSVDASSLRQHLLHHGDLILEKSGGGEKQPVGMAVLYEGEEEAVCSNFCSRISPAPDVDSRFLSYVFATAYGQGLTQSAIKQTTGIQNLDAGAFFSSPWAYPELEEQRRIADFLDAETARIDSLTKARRAQVDLIGERLDSVRDELFGSGVTDGAPTPLMYVTDPYRPIVYGIVQAGPEEPEGIPYVKTGDLKNLHPDSLSRTSPEIHAQFRRASVHPGDIVMAMRASIGAVAVIPPELPEANLTQGTARIAAKPGVDRQWLLQALQTRQVREQCDLRAVGSTFRTLNIWDLRRITINVVSTDLQMSLTQRFSVLESQHTRIRTAAQSQLSLLAERRQALITAAVTGQFDVSTASGRNVTDGVTV